jgi:diadenosine tetraphosphate (Ap4A) HIT family hydrolase
MVLSCSACTNNALNLQDLPDREKVFSSEHWRVLVHSSALPGWLVVVLRRHVESLSDLTEAETTSLGEVLAGGTRALMEVVGCIKTYAMLFGEGMPHLHFNLVPRMPDIPEALRGPKVFGYDADASPISDVERDSVARRLSAAWVGSPAV